MARLEATRTAVARLERRRQRTFGAGRARRLRARGVVGGAGRPLTLTLPESTAGLPGQVQLCDLRVPLHALAAPGTASSRGAPRGGERIGAAGAGRSRHDRHRDQRRARRAELSPLRAPLPRAPAPLRLPVTARRPVTR